MVWGGGIGGGEGRENEGFVVSRRNQSGEKEIWGTIHFEEQADLKHLVDNLHQEK